MTAGASGVGKKQLDESVAILSRSARGAELRLTHARRQAKSVIDVHGVATVAGTELELVDALDLELR